MGINISGVIIKKDFNQNISELQKLLGETLKETKKAKWEDYEPIMPKDGEVVVYSKNGASIVISNDHNVDLAFKLPLENDWVIYSANETAMAFNLISNINGETERDTYLQQGAFTQEGPNVFQLTEEDDIVHDGIFKIQNDWLGGTDDGDEVTVYSYKSQDKPTASPVKTEVKSNGTRPKPKSYSMPDDKDDSVLLLGIVTVVIIIFIIVIMI
ncbi:hypothetical protein GYB22_09740 [bacterium]|nr:hypothetical protein [bacterium]